MHLYIATINAANETSQNIQLSGFVSAMNDIGKLYH